MDKKQKWRDYMREYRRKNKDRVNTARREHRKENREKANEADRIWRNNHPENMKRIFSKYYQKTKAENLARVRKRELLKKQRVPKGADLSKIKEIYKQCKKISKETGIPHEVDHIVPLQGKNVSGFHVEWNLQIIPRTENRIKRNHYPTMEDEQ